MASNEYGTFGEVRKRLDEIVVEVRDKDLSLEKSLDLYEEAIKLGNRCAELVDKADYSEEEALAAKERLEAQKESEQPEEDGEGGAVADGHGAQEPSSDESADGK